MAIMVTFPRGTTLEERYRYITDKAVECQNKIVTYDSVLNEFALIKKKLDGIVSGSEYAIETCKNLNKIVVDHESSLKQSHQRTTDESKRSDSRVDTLNQKIVDLSEQLNNMSLKHQNNLNATEDSIRKELGSYMPNATCYSLFNSTSEFAYNLQSRAVEADRQISKLYDAIEDLRESSRKNSVSIEELHKELCRLQNAMVYNHSETMKKIKEVSR